jgi:catechol 2,3-dioxygenase-like lactoylglutathione lyase family enzyme
MDAIVSDLVTRFEKGALSRRGLIQGLTLLAATGASEAQDTGIKSVKIDHVSIQVTDLPRSIAFYQTNFGLTTIGEDKPNEIVRMGANGKVLVSLHHKSPTGIVDHFAIGVEKFNRDAVARQMKEHGLTAEDNLDAGFHVKDPEGISVQIVGA